MSPLYNSFSKRIEVHRSFLTNKSLLQLLMLIKKLNRILASNRIGVQLNMNLPSKLNSLLMYVQLDRVEVQLNMNLPSKLNSLLMYVQLDRVEVHLNMNLPSKLNSLLMYVQLDRIMNLQLNRKKIFRNQYKSQSKSKRIHPLKNHKIMALIMKISNRSIEIEVNRIPGTIVKMVQRMIVNNNHLRISLFLNNCSTGKKLKKNYKKVIIGYLLGILTK